MSSEIKPIYGTDRVKLAEVVPLKTPYSVFVFPTNFCNFKCKYCGHSLGFKEMKEKYNFVPEHMEMSTFYKIVDQLKEFPDKIKMISLTGQGEPLLNKNIAEMIAQLKKAGVTDRIEIISNGSLLRSELSDAIIDAGLDVLRISLQGLSSEKYKKVCGANVKFDEYMDNIRYFYKNRKNTKLYVKVIDVALDEGEEEQFYKLFKDCSDRMYVERMLPTYDGVEMTKDMKIEYDRYGGKVERVNKVCPFPFYMLGIFPNGDVEPCETIYKPLVLGNVNNGNLVEMWNSRAMREFCCMQLAGKRWDNKWCSICCAPNDVSHQEDFLDDSAENLLSKFQR